MIPRDLDLSLHSPDPETRRIAVGMLRQWGSAAIAGLLTALGDEDWRVRKEATQVIIELPPSRELAAALVGTFAPNENIGLKNAAVEALAALGASAVEALHDEAATLDADGRKLAAEALGLTRNPAAVGVLRQLASDGDQNVRIAALESIGHVASSCATSVADILDAALSAHDHVERLSALQSINELGITLDFGRLQSAAADPLLQRAVWAAATRMTDAASAQLLVQSIEVCRETDFPWAVSALAARINRDIQCARSLRAASAAFGLPRRAWLHQLITGELLEHRQAALVVLAALGGTDAVQASFSALDDDALAATAERALMLMNAEAISFLQDRVTVAMPAHVQALALEMLARLVQVDPSDGTLAAVSDALSSEHAAVLLAAFQFLERWSNERCLRRAFERFGAVASVVESYATRAMQSMVARHPQSAKDLIEGARLNSPHTLATVVTMTSLLKGPTGDTQTITEFLTRSLAHESPRVRRLALEALASHGHATWTDLALFALTDEEPEVRCAAVRALGRATDENALERLLDIVRVSDDSELVVSAVRALGESDNTRALQVLRPVARGGTPEVAVAAVEAIAQLSDTRRIDALIDSLGHNDTEVVKSALQMLAGESDLRANAHLGACLDHEAWDVRRLAADLLGRIGGDSVAALLRTKLAVETEPLVREAIVRALGDAEPVSFVRSNTPSVDVGSWRPK